MKGFIKLWAAIAWLCAPTVGFGFTANTVTYEIHPWFYRIRIEYTIPALKQLRVAIYETSSAEKARQLYWSLVQGGEFYVDKKGVVTFPPLVGPQPW